MSSKTVQSPMKPSLSVSWQKCCEDSGDAQKSVDIWSTAPETDLCRTIRKTITVTSMFGNGVSWRKIAVHMPPRKSGTLRSILYGL